MTQLTLAPLTNFDIGALAAAAIGVAAYRLRTLTAGGAIAAWAVGTATYGALAFPGAAILLGFFVTSVALSRIGRSRKRELLVDVGKTGARDASQVLANGGVAAACALFAVWIEPRFAVAFAGAFAAATADTWGTEIGTLSNGKPSSILTLRPVATGLSGGVTLVGTVAEVIGALYVAAIALAVGFSLRDGIAIGVAGMAGALVDSLLGASLQSLRWCPQCRRATETEPHECGANTTPLRGFSWCGNDIVNFAATLAGAGIAFTLAR